MSDDRNLFGDIEKLVSISVLEQTYQVPDRLEMLRVFQFLDYEIDYSRLCWNASCQRCFIGYEKLNKKTKALACRTRAFEGMRVTQLPSAIRKPKTQDDPEA